MEAKALVLDDDACCLDVCTEYLMDRGFQVSSFLGPNCPMIAQNLERCPMDGPCYDLVLSDNQMPEMTGLEFFSCQEKGGCKIPASHKALISGDISRKEQKIATIRGYKIFQKPTSLDQIDNWIDNVLGQEA